MKQGMKEIRKHNYIAKLEGEIRNEWNKKTYIAEFQSLFNFNCDASCAIYVASMFLVKFRLLHIIQVHLIKIRYIM